MSKKNKIVLVTGAASGIGLSITKFLALKGDHVLAADINEKGLEPLKEFENITPLVLDVTDSTSIENGLKEISKITDRLDGIVNNAGLFVGGPLIEIKEQEMERIFSVNVLGPFKITKAFFPLLYQAKGRVINIGSEVGRFSFPLNGPYSMTKFAIKSFSDSLRRELMFLDMKVVLLEIGAINTPLLYQTYCSYAEEIDYKESKFKRQLDAVIKTCEKEMKRSADPIAVAKKVHRALHAKNPRSRYRIKNNRIRRLLEFFPTFVVDFAMKKVLK